VLLESHLKDNSIVVFDCESVAAIDKGGLTVRGHPDKVLPSMVDAIKGIAKEIGDAVAIETLPAPSTMEVRFGLKVDSNGIVSVARNDQDGQVHVLLRFG
jgi:hypothetical protein